MASGSHENEAGSAMDRAEQPPVRLALGAERVLVVHAREDRAGIRVCREGDARPEIEIEIVITPAGPVLRARAAGLELDATDKIVARCREFRVEAEESIALEAARGGVTVRANDDVKLLGEQILLNCEREPPMPAWVPVARGPDATAAPRVITGDADLARAVFKDLPDAVDQ